MTPDHQAASDQLQVDTCVECFSLSFLGCYLSFSLGLPHLLHRLLGQLEVEGAAMQLLMQLPCLLLQVKHAETVDKQLKETLWDHCPVLHKLAVAMLVTMI